MHSSQLLKVLDPDFCSLVLPPSDTHPCRWDSSMWSPCLAILNPPSHEVCVYAAWALSQCVTRETHFCLLVTHRLERPWDSYLIMGSESFSLSFSCCCPHRWLVGSLGACQGPSIELSFPSSVSPPLKWSCPSQRSYSTIGVF